MGLGGVTGLDLGVGSGPALSGSRGLEALSLGNIMGTMQPMGPQRASRSPLRPSGTGNLPHLTAQLCGRLLVPRHLLLRVATLYMERCNTPVSHRPKMAP